MGEYEFEKMCVALLDKQPDVSLSDGFGDRGQKQFGADIIADLTEGGLIVAQCKCYEVFRPANIDAAVQIFLEHLDYWKEKDACRFVLMVAAPMTEKRRKEKYLHWKAELKKLGVTFELWGQDVIANRLGPHRAIVSRYLDPGWVERLCGTPSPEYGATQDLGTSALSLTIDRFVSAEIKQVTELYFSGQPKSALDQVKRLRDNSAAWLALPPERRAEVLRTEAQIRLTQSDSPTSLLGLADQADALAAPKSGPVLRALIGWQEKGAEAALALLDGHTQGPAQQLRALLLAQLNRFEEAEKELTAMGAEADGQAETWRVRALARLDKGDLEGALDHADHALRSSPRSRVMRELRASLLFYGALAPMAVPARLDYLPSPVDWLLVRRDDRSVQRLREAEQTFAALLSECELSDRDRTAIRLWRLACLCCMADWRDAAEDEAGALLHEDRTNPLAIGWAMARNLTFNRERSRTALENLRDGNRATYPHILALVALYHSAGQLDKARRTLKAARPLFIKDDHDELWLRWHDKIAKPTDEKDALADIADIPINELLLLCLNSARQGEHQFVVDHAERLCHEIGTADAIALAAQACLNLGYLEKYQAILSQWSGCFPGGTIPVELRRAQITAQFHRGQVENALIEAERLAAQSSDVTDSLRLADFRLRIGDLSGAARALKPVAGRPEIPVNEVVRLSYILAEERPDVARQLLGSVDAAMIPPDYLPLGYLAANRLGVCPEVMPVVGAFHQAMATTGLPGVLMANDVADLRAVMQESHDAAHRALAVYRSGRVPVHLLADEQNIPMTKVTVDWLARNKDRTGWPPSTLVMIRHGGRAFIEDFPSSPSDWRLHIDITSLLLAFEIGLLDIVEQCFSPLHVSPRLPAALLAMADQVGGDGNPKDKRSRCVGKLRDHVARQIQDGHYLFAQTRRDDAEDEGPPGVDLAVLEDMIRLERIDGTVFWCDDRLINGHKTIAEAAPIMSIQDMLDALRKYGHLDEGEHWRMLSHLREGNAAFLLPCKEEILYWLTRAQIRDSQVVESPELEILRRNLASAAAGPLQGQNLDPVIGNTNGELLFAVLGRRAVSDAVVACLGDGGQSRDSAFARADWIWNTLWIDFPPQWQAWGRSPDDLEELAAISFASLFSSAFSLGFKGDDSPRARALQWLRVRVTDERLMFAPSLLEATSRILAHILCALCSDVKDEGDLRLTRHLIADYLQDLPHLISRQMRQDPDMRRNLANVTETVTTLGSHHFTPAPFFLAINSAANGRDTAVTSQDGITFTVSRREAGARFHLLFTNESSEITLTGVASGALLADPGQRQAYLEAHGAELDLTGEDLQSLITDIATVSDPDARIERIHAAVKNTCTHCYETVRDLLQSSETDEFPIDQLLPPSLDAMLRFLRLDPTEPPEAMLEHAAERLLASLGLEEALWRISSIPAPLPTCLISAARSLSRHKFLRMAMSWAKRPASHLSMLHLIHLVTEVVGRIPMLGNHIKAHLADTGWQEHHATLLNAIGWVWHAFLRMPGYRDLPAGARLALAWCHGDKLFGTFLATGQQVTLPRQVSLAMLAEQCSCGIDVTLGRHLSEPLFLIQGLAYALGSHATNVLGKEGADLLRPHLVSPVAELPVPLTLLRNMPAAPNPLGSFLGNPVDRSLAFLGFEDEAAGIREFHGQAHEILLREDTSPWSWLVGLYPHLRLPSHVADRARNALLACDVWSLCRTETIDAWGLLIYLAESAGQLGGSAGIDHIREQVFKAAEYLTDANQDTTARQTLLHALAILASYAEEPLARANNLAEDVRKLVEIVPAAAPETRILVRHLMESLDMKDIGHLMEALLELRTYR